MAAVSKSFNLIFLGPQGSGKGTQAKLLADRLNLVVIDTGATLREIAKTDTDLGRRVAETINRGRLVEPELAEEVVRQKVEKISTEQGIVIDGFPRSLEQYTLMKRFWPQTKRADYQVIFIDLTLDASIERLGKRVTCELCGSVYIVGEFESCQNCGGNLVHRADDEPDAIAKRLELFPSQTKPLLQQLEREGKIIKIDGAPSIEEVQADILKKLNLA